MNSTQFNRHGRVARIVLACTAVGILAGTECPVYPDSPLFGGGRNRAGNQYELAAGSYAGVADCTRFFQNRGRPGTLDQFTQEFAIAVDQEGKLHVGETPVQVDAELQLTLGIFELERTVSRLSSTDSERVVNFHARVNVNDDSQNVVELSGPGSETYSHLSPDTLSFSFAVQLTTADTTQETMSLAFECSATLARE